MKLILYMFLAGSLSMPAMSEESKAVNYIGGASAQPKIVRQPSKPLRWLRLAGRDEVEFPLWLSLRGIPKLEPAEEARSFRFAVERENGGEGATATAASSTIF